MPAAVLLYLIASACGGDDAATITATPVSTNGPSATASSAASTAPATSSGALANTPAHSGDREVELLDSGFTALRGDLQGGLIAHNKDKTEAVAINYNIPFLDSAGANAQVTRTGRSSWLRTRSWVLQLAEATIRPIVISRG